MHTLGTIDGSKTAPTPGALAIEVPRLEPRPLNEKTLRFALNVTLPSGPKLVLLAMADMCETDDGIIATTYADVARWAGMRDMYARQGLKMLVDTGLVKILGQERPRSPVKYQIVMG